MKKKHFIWTLPPAFIVGTVGLLLLMQACTPHESHEPTQESLEYSLSLFDRTIFITALFALLVSAGLSVVIYFQVRKISRKLEALGYYNV